VIGNETRIVIVGDELAVGRGDPKALGWPGRVLARTDAPTKVTGYVLAVPNEASTMLANRWEPEATRRFHPDGPNRLVVGLGWSDLDAGVTVARARLNLANILDRAAALHVPTMVIGPPPRSIDASEHQKIADYSQAFAEVAARRETPYVETFAPLQNHEQWLADMRASGGTWPSQSGYGLLAWLVLHNHWDSWLTEPA